MAEDKRVTKEVGRFNELRAKRSSHERDWRDFRDYVRPVSVEFYPTTRTYTTVRPETVYDGTAGDALEELASALHSYLSSPSERWFQLQIEGVPSEDLDGDALEWLEHVSDMIYAQYCREDCTLPLAMHEAYLDLGSFGTAVMYQEWSNNLGGLLFQAQPLQQCYLAENSEGRVDTCYRLFQWTMRQLAQAFPDFATDAPQVAKKTDPDQLIQILHCVYPRSDRDYRKVDAGNKAFASKWIVFETKEFLYESGYDTFPFHSPRWTKLATEVYGRGPGMKCLPEIKMLNRMEMTLLKAGQKQVDPPLVLANEGWLLPIKTSPGSIIYKEDEERKIEALQIEGNLPWGEDKAQQKREFIKKCYHSDWIRRERKNPNVEQTAAEIQDDRDEMLRMLSPIFGRITSELLGPMIARSYQLLHSRAMFPPAPASIQKKDLRVGYMSMAARAQTGAKANEISRFILDITPLAQIDPGVMDVIDLDRAAQEIAIARGMRRTVLRSAEEIATLREQKQKMAQAQQIAATAEPVSKAVKNLADAQAAGGVPT